MEDPKQAVGVVKREVVQVITPGTVVDSSKPDSQNNFLVSLDCDGNQFGLAYMDLVTGDFYVTGLLDFTLVCGEIRNLKAREVVLGYDLSEEEEQILSCQMNLVLSYEKDGFEDIHLLDPRLASVEQAAASKLLQYVHRTQMRELNHLKPVIHYEIKDFLQMDYATKASLDWLRMPVQARSRGVFSGFWMKPKQLWACGSCALGSIVP